MNDETIRERNGDVLLNLKVKPNSDKFEIIGVNEWDNRLHVKLKSPAKNNEANEELLREFGELFDRNVELFSGKISRKKTILIGDISKRKVNKLLGI